MEKITVKDIAKMSGYSVSTVSKALNGTDRVSTETAANIKRIAEECGYRSSFTAQSLARRKRKIAIVIYKEPQEIRTMFEEGFDSAFSLYSEFGIEPVYYYFGSSDIPDISCVPWEEIESTCDGLIFTPSNINGAFGECISNIDRIGNKIPTVSLLMKYDGFSVTDNIASVTVDAGVVGSLAAQFLSVSYGKRKCRAAVITGYKDEWIHKENVESFIAAGKNFDIDTVAVEECFNDMDEAYRLTKKLLKEHGDIDGIFATSYVSPGICKALDEERRKDLTLIGVDLGKDAVEYMKSGILDAVIFQNQKMQAEKSVECIVGSFRGSVALDDIYIKPELVLLSNFLCYA
ncbi:MAG: LacI family transcriptional regulator [Ruminococcaceae bacterium]|nr:LacI family transcriptional regulator [Oscillospiraceae bacterium]